MQNVLDEIKKFFVKNTPEAALGAALLAAVGAYFTGALSPHDAVLAAVTALVAFGFAESHKDAAEAKP